MLSKENIDLTQFNQWKCDVKKNVYQFGQVCNLIKAGGEKKHGGIILKPDYQREYKFGIKKESSIIESLLLNIPIPVIYLSQDIEQEKVLLNVIDGAHRLRAMYRYSNNDFELTDLKILKSLNGYKFNQLPANVRNRLEMDTQINIECINVSENQELEYEVFTRFNQATNPLKKQELYEVVYRSEFSSWIRNVLIENLCKKDRFKKMFKYSLIRKRDKTLNYDLYVCLGYSYSGLIEGKNDTPYYVERFMEAMKKLTHEKLELKKVEIENYINDFIDFYNKISNIEGIEYVFSKEFVTKKTPKGNHNFLISFLITLTLSYDYLVFKGIFQKNKLQEEDYHEIYQVIVDGMTLANFLDFGNISSTSYKFQKKCLDSIKESIDKKLDNYF